VKPVTTNYEQVRRDLLPVARLRGTFDEFFGVGFSSVLCTRAMLRRPSNYQATPREEGCSSTAYGFLDLISQVAWNNLASRGST